uniref:Serine carboxypeptidase n=1 Tax=Pinus taeda TaxID=3352 RepID=A0A5B8LFT7_PINTA|nr:serine carboxypeptidase [Pinus taeda]
MEILKAVELLIFSAMMTAAIAPSHQHTTQSDVLRSWLIDRTYNSHGLQTAEWASESSLLSLRNDSEYLSESKNEGRRKSTDYLPHGLPGQPTGFKFRQYSGYVTVNASAGRALFYYFAEAFPHPSKRPLVLWFNGGPGCSSLGYGAMTELGPFWVNPDGKTLHFNRYSWNRGVMVAFLQLNNWQCLHTKVSDQILQISIHQERNHLLEYYHQFLSEKGNQQLHSLYLVDLQL